MTEADSYQLVINLGHPSHYIPYIIILLVVLALGILSWPKEEKINKELDKELATLKKLHDDTIATYKLINAEIDKQQQVVKELLAMEERLLSLVSKATPPKTVPKRKTKEASK